MSAAPSDAPRLVRRNHGRGHSYKLDGEKTLAVTQILDHSMAKPALPGWAARTAAEYAVDHWDDLDELGPTNRLELIRGAPWREKTEKAARGTLIHDYAVRLAAGEDIEVPEEIRGHVDAYLKFADDWQLEELIVEAPVGTSGPRSQAYAGTLDLLGLMARADTDDVPETWILDYKTGKGVYPEVTLQLAAYRFAEFYIDAAGNAQPMPEIDRAGVVHIRADGYDLYEVRAEWAEFRTFQFAQQVAIFAIDEASEENVHISAALAPPPPRSRA